MSGPRLRALSNIRWSWGTYMYHNFIMLMHQSYWVTEYIDSLVCSLYYNEEYKSFMQDDPVTFDTSTVRVIQYITDNDNFYDLLLLEGNVCVIAHYIW
jgi:hypothetical protein